MQVRAAVGYGRGRVVLIVGAFVAATVGALTLASRSTASLPVANESALNSAEPGGRLVAAVEASELANQPWPVGMQRAYNLDFGSGSQADASSNNSEMLGTGKLTLVAQHADERGRTLRGSFSDLVFFDANPEDSEADSKREGRRALTQDLARPFLVFMKDDGSIEAISVDPALDGGALAFVRAYLAAWQFVEPSGPNPSWRKWTALETDNFGVCAARYERVGENQFKKLKSEYRYLDMTEKLAPPDGAPAKDQARISSEAIVEVARGVVRKAEMNESVDAPLGDVTIRTKSHLTLELLETQRVQVTPFLPTGWKRELLYATRDASPEQRLAEQRRLLGKATFTELWAELRALKTKPANDGERWDLVDRLAALFQLQPESLAEAMRVLRGAARDEAQHLLAALAGAKTPEAQAALGEVAADSAIEAGVRRGAIMRLALQEAPTENTLDSLDTLSKTGDNPSLRDTALLALGGAARRASGVESTQVAAKDAIRELERGAATAEGLERRTLLLSALGNTGSPDILGTLRVYLTDSDPNVRSAAVNALRLIPGAEVDALLAGILAGDAEPLVRRGAAEALGSRSIDGRMLDVLSTALRGDADVQVRLGVVGVLSARVTSVPAVRELLTWASTHDAEAVVREAAARALDPGAAKSTRGSK